MRSLEGSSDLDGLVGLGLFRTAQNRCPSNEDTTRAGCLKGVNLILFRVSLADSE